MTTTDPKTAIARSSTPTRRRVLAGIGAGIAAAPLLGRPAIAQSSPPIRIGVLNTFSKVYAFQGESNFNGLTQYLDSVGNEVAGRKIEIIREDDEVNPQVGLTKIKKLVEHDGVDFVVGPQGSNVAVALLPYIRQTKTFLLVNGAGNTALTWERMPNLFRCSISSWQISHPMAEWVYANLSKEVVLAASDYAGGRDAVETFKRAFLKMGGKILKEVYPPLGTSDYSSYLLDIKSVAPPAIYSFFAGTDAVRFVKQFTEFGLKDKITLTGYAALVDADTTEGQGTTAVGVLTANIYADTLDNPANKAFVAEYRKRYGAYPNLYSDYGFTAGRVLYETLKQTGGKTSDKDALSAAMVKVKFDDPRGPFEFDPVSHNPIQNVHVFKAIETDGRIKQQLLTTIEKVRDPAVKDA